jgi:hypothetical protein
VTTQSFVFTFGSNHTLNGESLKGKYIVLEGDIESTRQQMFTLFGRQWSMQYSTKEDAGVDQFNLTELPIAVAMGRRDVE